MSKNKNKTKIFFLIGLLVIFGLLFFNNQINDNKILFELLDANQHVIDKGMAPLNSANIFSFQKLDPLELDLPIDLSNPNAESLKITFIIKNKGNVPLVIEINNLTMEGSYYD